MRPTLGSVLASRLPKAVGLCSTDVAGVSMVVNSATQRLMFCRELGDTSWWGLWAELAFTVTRESPHIILPYGFTRIEVLNMCTYPVVLENEFFSYLRFGQGKFPKAPCATRGCAPLIVFDRGTVALLSGELAPPNKKIRVYPTDAGDVGKRLLLQGLDANGIPVRTLDGVVQVLGEFITLTLPFSDSVNEYTAITGVQKDVTLARVQLYQLDTVDASQSLVSYMEPSEVSASYRKYFVSGVPRSCCDNATVSTDVQVTAICLLDYVPIAVVTDYLLIPNVEALTNEAQSIRYSEMDLPNAKQMESYHHTQAIRLLQGQLVATQGSLQPAVSFAPFRGSPFVTTGYG